MPGAAFFDLDRTLLQGGTGPHLTQAMVDLGLVPRSLPGQGLLFKAFDLVGENLPSILLARQATLVARGKDQHSFDDAAARAAEVIAELVHPFALALIEQHKAEGRRVVMATTTPEHLIKPLADRLGFDDVLATRYGTKEDGRFDGSIRGPFVWSTGKLTAVRHFAAQHDIDLAESCLLGLDLRRAAPRGGGPTCRGQPRSQTDDVCRGSPLADRALRRVAGCAQDPRGGHRAAEVRPRGPAVDVGSRARASTSRALRTSRATGRPSSSATTAATSTPSPWPTSWRKSGRTARVLGGKELFDVPVLRLCSSPPRVASGSTAGRGATESYGHGGTRPRGRRDDEAAPRRGPFRGVRPSSTPCSRARPGRRASRA